MAQFTSSFHVHSKDRPIRYLSPEDVKNHAPYSGITSQMTIDANARAKQRMQVAGVWTPNQVLGRGYPIGCVALEITQRCNLDCTLCYLSEMSESTKDIPFEELIKRLEMIQTHYGPGTDVQITGGDPTLRKRSELLEIVRRVKLLKMRPTLMTNGIAATRDLLTALCEAGLHDVAFHVDLTQERKGYSSEVEMNRVRLEYIQRAKGLPLHVIFNTTVFEKNYEEIPELVRFFTEHTDVVGMASFQLQAETGRGELRKRNHDLITLDNVLKMIQIGTGTKVSWDTVQVGHPRCHKYGLLFELNGKLYDFFDEPNFFSNLIDKTSSLKVDRNRPIKSIFKILHWAFTTRGVVWPGLKFIIRKLWGAKKDLILGGFKIRKLSFFAQNFMDASSLEVDRIHACSFMVMTPQGPISMCMHNAKRDDFILQNVEVTGQNGKELWNPLTGKPIHFDKLPVQLEPEPAVQP